MWKHKSLVSQITFSMQVVVTYSILTAQAVWVIARMNSGIGVSWAADHNGALGRLFEIFMVKILWW